MSVELWTLETLVEAYKQHQRRTRGLREQTLHGYERFVRLFVRAALGDDPIDPGQLGPADVVGFMAAMRWRFSPRSMKAVRTALRSFFRFLRVEGLCDERLEAALPRVAYWRLSMLPRCLSDEQLALVLASLDASRPCGRRDRAIVVCLASLGLRPGELADLRLEDIDWRAGTILLRERKTRRGAVLPLPREAGRAVVAYLREERPATKERRVFVQQLGARRGRPLTGNAVSGVVVRALRRGGVEAPLAGAYVLRHTVASRLVRRGASLKEVADLLGHRALDTTTIYAKLDLAALREVALPWPQKVTR
ncbi:Site-specific recombinase XerD [Gaiella occulta]|uniref:Site-specific recombinase XerD n=1 Tax=Gaiella occulta TaxID=1002870 RepID=A0A7M2YU48_9ACTN|nr:site-specific integrase [Gaiella occulta]RDI73606.1 Site-specific recombinase XerD [Gaiella occulta]